MAVEISHVGILFGGGSGSGGSRLCSLLRSYLAGDDVVDDGNALGVGGGSGSRDVDDFGIFLRLALRQQREEVPDDDADDDDHAHYGEHEGRHEAARAMAASVLVFVGVILEDVDLAGYVVGVCLLALGKEFVFFLLLLLVVGFLLLLRRDVLAQALGAELGGALGAFGRRLRLLGSLLLQIGRASCRERVLQVV